MYTTSYTHLILHNFIIIPSGGTNRDDYYHTTNVVMWSEV